jgi:glycosyltransferase involved in cell wall biosynthesis
MKSCNVSFVIPLKDEVETLETLYQKIVESITPLDLSFEVIFVDDGSTDGSFEIIKKLHMEDPRVKGIRFRRNFGKSSALSAGFKKAVGDIVITMDADLQDDPTEIPRFIEMINKGYDVVSGWKKVRYDPLSKTLPSRFFNRITAWATGVDIHDFNCGFKAYRKEVVKSIEIYGELHRYIPALAYGKGFTVGEIVVTHHPRKYGRSKYGWERLFKGLLDLFTVVFLTRFFKRPMHIFGGTGAVMFVLGFIINLYLVIHKFLTDTPIGNRPLLTLGVLCMILGIQSLSLGLLGEMINNISSDRKEEYFILEEV